MNVFAWEKRRADLIATAMKDVIVNGVFGDDVIPTTLSAAIRAQILADTSLDPQLRLAAYGMLAGLREVEPWQAPTFQGSSTNYGGGNMPVAFFKDPFGQVHLRGLVAGASVSTVIFTLPPGYRPSQYVNVGITADRRFANLVIQPDGQIYINAADSATPQNYASFASVYFDTRA